MQQQANSSPLAIKSDVDHRANDFDSICYIPDSLAGDTYVPDSSEDVEEEASVAEAVVVEKRKGKGKEMRRPLQSFVL
jgi:hypothetical protein